jgi:hypothetical protein
MISRIVFAATVLSLSCGALAVTDFISTVTPGPTNAQPTLINGWTFEQAAGNDGAENRMGGDSNPDSIGTEFSVSGQAGKWANYNYAAGGEGGLTGSYTATFDATFRARNVNNGTNAGSPILSLSLANGVGVSLSIVNNPDDTYHYKLVQFDAGSATNVLHDIEQFATDSVSDHQDFTYNRAVLTVDVTGHVKLDWSGDYLNQPLSTVFEQTLSPMSGVESRAWFGAGTIVQPVAGNAKSHVWFQSVTLSASSVPEPATLSLLVLGGLGVLRRRR